MASGLAETDPTHALKDALISPTRKHRAAITDPKSLGKLMNAIDEFDGQATTRIALQLLATLAQRPGEIRHAQWEDIDFNEKVWSIPARKMKMRRDHNVPLPAQAIDLLDQLRMITGNGIYLFPSLRSWQRPMSENTLNAALRRMGYSGRRNDSARFSRKFFHLGQRKRPMEPRRN